MSDRIFAKHINLIHSPTRSFCHGIGFVNEREKGNERAKHKNIGKPENARENKRRA